jgi:hypothetical protein
MKGELHISAREATACTYLPDDKMLAEEINKYLFNICLDMIYEILRHILHSFPVLKTAHKTLQIH